MKYIKSYVFLLKKYLTKFLIDLIIYSTIIIYKNYEKKSRLMDELRELVAGGIQSRK